MTKQPQEVALLAESGRLLASVFGLLDRTSLVGMSIALTYLWFVVRAMG